MFMIVRSIEPLRALHARSTARQADDSMKLVTSACSAHKLKTHPFDRVVD